MYDDIVKRLESFGYSTDPTIDDWVIGFLIDKITNTIKNECNVDEIPAGLYQIAVDMVCGEFLKNKGSTGQLAGTAIKTEAAIKQIKEGDTSITYAVAENSEGAVAFDYLVDFLINYGKPQLATYRRLVW